MPSHTSSPTAVRTNTPLSVAAPRMEQFDRVKTFCMWCVIWGHFILSTRSEDIFRDPVFTLTGSFHMPLFLCLSGWFSTKTLQLSFSPFLLQQMRRLLLPVLTWCVLLIVPIALCQTPFRPERYAHALLSEYWFLRALFLCFVGTWVCLRLPRRWMKVAGIVFLLFATYRYYFSFAFAFFLSGLCLRNAGQLLFGRHVLRTTLWAGVFFGALLVFWDGAYTVYMVPGVTWKNLAEAPQAAPCRLWIEIYRYAIGLVGSVFFMGLGHLVFLRGRAVRLLQWMGRYTLGAYIMHIAFFSYTVPYLFTLDAVPALLCNWMLLPVAAFLVQLLLARLQQLLERNRVAGFLLFGRPLKARQVRQ